MEDTTPISFSLVDKIFKSYIPEGVDYISANRATRKEQGLTLINGITLKRDIQRGEWYLTGSGEIPSFLKELKRIKRE